ncbi:MAG: hypothetical protein QOK60_09745 [Nitrososphaeraceae archaeon]|jgi:hypothetical protein|nr:hypothetical protein [Nitrososphaeraceae archaeon]
MPLTINEEFRLRKKVAKLEIEKSELEMLTADVAELKRMMKKKHGNIRWLAILLYFYD